ncbi:MAG: hypothetical protein GOV01_03175 [Candidatus Altiarchaeota archaeon]|nr:hypothetical protein [Candidatus Altiarchaeota archaeon]
MNLSESLELLSKYKIKTSGKLVSLEQALKLPRPAVLKADTIEHKKDKGLVFVGLVTDDEIKFAYNKISKKYPVFGQPLIEGFELMIGALEDPIFGKTVMVGFGGTYTELFKDVSFRAVPLTRNDAETMLSELKIYKVFEGFRGKTLNKQPVIDALIGLSNMCERVDFKEADINPLMIGEYGALAVDARVIM